MTIFSVIQGYCCLKPATALAKPFFSDGTVHGCQTVRVTGVWSSVAGRGGRRGACRVRAAAARPASSQGEHEAATVRVTSENVSWRALLGPDAR